MTTYWRIGKSRVVHKDLVMHECHYFQRVLKELSATNKKPRNCSYCDECQRLEKKARAAGKRPKP
jgi:hypothetical protein